ncbi:IS5 family transposase (plasmid) [Azospirillum sp. A26]|uniref:IS5 family transposase n=1 Tax=Azospirillum sp. A26 TaxID=3160607 RepID=UPI003672C417
MPHKTNEPRRHKIPKARYRVENWAAYDAALRQRGDLTIWVTPEAIDAWTPPATRRGGRPARYSDLAIETGLMLRLAFGRPWRQTEGLLGALMRLLGLDLPVPDHTTFSRRSADLEMASTLARTDGPVTVVIDSTGLKVFGRGEWHLEKHGGTARRCWRKLHLAVDPATGEILASALTGNEEGDASLVGPLLDQITIPIGAVLADGAYDGEPVLSRAESINAPSSAPTSSGGDPAVGIVVNQDEVGSPQDGLRQRGVRHQIHDDAQERRPVLLRPERRTGPVEGSDDPAGGTATSRADLRETGFFSVHVRHPG